ncbi:hypothetical protein BGZ83_007154 [Gryganskiella cystojenkinii]|nr:hypothetical protein BGZ83_007154 [Gryganskiella cystojenkinii]
MLQDAGVSPTEVENNLAVVVEEETITISDDDPPEREHQQQNQQLQLLVTSEEGCLVGHVRPIKSTTTRRRRTAAEDGLFDDSSSSILLFDDEEREEQLSQQQQQQHNGGVDDEEDDTEEFMSSSGTLSFGSSSCATQLTRPNLSCQPSNAVFKSTKATVTADQSSTSPALTAMGKYRTMVAVAGTAGLRRSTAGIVRPFSPTNSEISIASQLPLPAVSRKSPDAKTQDSETQAQNEPSPSFGQHLYQHGGRTVNGSQSPIPSFIAESFAAGTLGIKTLRERWVMASGVLSWNKPRSTTSDQQQHPPRSGSSSIVTSPSGLFIRREGIVNEKKPAVVETCLPPPLLDELSTLDQYQRDEQDRWTTTNGRKQHSKGRPLSEVAFMGSNQHPTKYQSMTTTMARDIPRPPITRIHEYLEQQQQRPESFNPSPLHYRAISMAANLIDTGAITPAKLYARRTQTMIAKWTLGLIMNSSKPRQQPRGFSASSASSAFPVIRESLSSEHEDGITGGRHRPSCDKNEDAMLADPHRRPMSEMEMVSDYGTLSPAEIPRALSYKSHATVPNLISSSYPHSSSQYYYPHHHIHTSQSVVELSDISSAPLSMSPTFSYLGEAIQNKNIEKGSNYKPLTDRYGFLVHARPMAVQQGLMKLNEDLDTPQFERGNGGGMHSRQNSGTGFEFLKTSPGEEEEEPRSRPVSPPPFFSSFSFGQIAQHGGMATSAVSNVSSGSSKDNDNDHNFSGNIRNGSLKPPKSNSSGMTTSNSSTGIATSLTSPILSIATRPMSTLSPPNSSSAAATTLLSQIKVLHDSVQMTQKEKWDAFLKKRRRRVHLGETTSGALGNMSSTNLGTPLLFGNLMAAATSTSQDEQDYLQQQQEDEDVMYWTSVCIIGIATIGKGSDWEEFRELTRGGIPVMYRNKIWQEASGAFDMRQPGYYKELLSRQDPESSPCWGDIEMVSEC